LSHEQNSLIDSIVNKGDLKITLEDTTVMFRDMEEPASTAIKIVEFKDKIL